MNRPPKPSTMNPAKRIALYATLALSGVLVITLLVRVVLACADFVSIEQNDFGIDSCATGDSHLLHAFGRCEDQSNCGAGILWDKSGSGSLNPAYPPTCDGDGYAESWRYYQPSAGATMPSTETITVTYCGKSDSIDVTVRPRASGSLSGGGACPGQDVNITARVRNTMGCTESFTWSVQKRVPDPPYDPGEASVSFTPSSGSTGPIEGGAWSDPIPITATVGQGSPRGSHADIELVVEVSGAEATDPDNRPDATIGVPGQSADGVIGGASGCPGDTIEIPKTITNRGACPESFDWKIVQIAGDLNLSDVSGSTPTLEPNESDSTPAQMMLPSNSPLGGTATVELQIKLNGTYVAKDTATIGVPGPSCIAALGGATGCPGTSIGVPMSITNTGPCRTTFKWKVEQDPAEDPVVQAPAQGSTTLDPSETYNTPAQLSILADPAADTGTLQLKVWCEQSNSCNSESTPGCQANGSVSVIRVELKSVIFASDHGVLTDYDTDFGGSGGNVYNPRGWRKAPPANNPITHTKDTKISANITIRVIPAGLIFDLSGFSTEQALMFLQLGVLSTGADQTIPVQGTNKLAKKIAVLEDSINWTVTFANPVCASDAGSSGPHKVYVTWGTPGPGPTIKRVQWAVEAADGATTVTEVCDAIHSALDADPPNDGNTGTIVDDWRLMDGSPYVGECHNQANLMKLAVNFIGVSGGATFFVYGSRDCDSTNYETRTAAEAGITWDLDGDGTVGEETVGLRFDFDGGAGTNINAFEGAVDFFAEAGYHYAVWPSLKATSKCDLLLEVGATGAVQCYVLPADPWEPIRHPTSGDIIVQGYPTCAPGCP